MQVERVRELEISAVRLEEAAKFRRALEDERQELDKVVAHPVNGHSGPFRHHLSAGYDLMVRRGEAE